MLISSCEPGFSVARTSSGNENYTAIERAVTEDSDPGREVRKQVVRESCSKGEVGGNSFHTTAWGQDSPVLSFIKVQHVLNIIYFINPIVIETKMPLT